MTFLSKIQGYFSTLGVRHRYILTREGNLRGRYIALTIGISVFAIWGAMTSHTTNVGAYVSHHRSHDDPVALTVARIEPATGVVSAIGDPEMPGRGLVPYIGHLGQKPAFDRPYEWSKIITVESGDTLGALLEQASLTGADYMTAVAMMKEYIDPRDVRPGQKIAVRYRNEGQISGWLDLDYQINGLITVSLQRDDNNNIIAKKHEKPVETKIHAARATVNASLFADLGKMGVPDGIIHRLIKAYSWSVDFQRDIWGGETVELFYETNETEDGSYMRSGRLLYANLTMRSGKSMPIYLFEKEPGFETYFEPDGQSIRKALLKTPIDGARMSSGYGARKHPVLGYNKMHRGVDFAAPRGTPIYAAGDGIVVRANWFSSFGNYVKVRHGNGYETAYAHMNGFAKGIKSGTRVKQGQTIGYVGTTGRSTGPHLHYEIHVNGQAVNPNGVNLPIGEKLKGNDLKRFTAAMGQIKQRYAKAVRDSSTFAALDDPSRKKQNH